MNLQAQKPLLYTLWHRIKRFLVEYPAGPKGTHSRSQRRLRFLERCYLEDDAIEATRTQLESCWEDASI